MIEELPGEALHNERIARFAMLAAENPAQAYQEYGLTLIHSIHEADSAAYLKSLEVGQGDEPFLLAVAAHRRGTMDEVEKTYEKIAKDPKRGEALYNLAVLRAQRGDDEGAREAIDRFLAFLAKSPRTPYQKKALALAQALREELGEDNAG